jgi:O-antigen ligase
MVDLDRHLAGVGGAAGALLIGGLYLLEPIPAAGLAAALLFLALLAVWQPLAVLALIAATLPLFHRPLEAGGATLAPSELLLLAVLSGTGGRLAMDLIRDRATAQVLVSRFLRTLKDRRGRFGFWFALLAVMTVAGLALLAGVDAPDARSAGLREWRWTLAEPLAFLGLLVWHARDQRERVLIAAGYGAGVLGVAGWGAADALLGQGVAAGGVLRVDGPFPHPNAYALYLLRAVVAATALLVVTRTRNLLLWGLAGFAAAALLASFARSAMLGLLVAGSLMLPWLSRRARVGAGLLAAGAVALLVAVAGERMVGTSGTDSLALREDIWRSGLTMVRDRPLVGYGPDQFLYVYTPRYIDPAAWAERFTSHGHNFLIDAWVRIGIIGAVFALLALLAVARAALRGAREHGTCRPLAVATTFALAAALAQGMVDNGYFVHDLAMSAWLLAWLSFDGPDTLPPERSPGG